MRKFRATAIVLTQLPLLLFLGGKHDLLFGFNQTSAGLHTLVVLFFAVPLIDLAWVVTECKGLFNPSEEQGRKASGLMVLASSAFLAEALAADLYILSAARM